MLDHDPDEVALSREDLVALIRSAAPGLAGSAMLWWPSASSHICDAETGRDLTGLRGQRIYLMVSEAADVPRAGAALVDRFWAAGQGRIVVSVAGAALERCPIDSSVWQPERLDFAAGACCGMGLVQRRGEPLLIPGGCEIVDTRVALPDDPAISKAAAAAPPARQGGGRGRDRRRSRGLPGRTRKRAACSRGPRGPGETRGGANRHSPRHRQPMFSPPTSRLRSRLRLGNSSRLPLVVSLTIATASTDA